VLHPFSRLRLPRYYPAGDTTNRPESREAELPLTLASC
jgi:hypothetical protein